MKIRRAILLAANRIARHPKLFNFYTTEVPRDCNSPGCALGWVRFYFCPNTRRHSYMNIAPRALINDDSIFYRRMSELTKGKSTFERTWRNSASLCAAGMRAYANRFHPLRFQADRGGVK